MDRLPANVQRRYARGSQDNRGLGGVLPQVVQERRFPRPGLPCKKHALSLVFNEIKGEPKLFVEIDLIEIERFLARALTRGSDKART